MTAAPHPAGLAMITGLFATVVAVHALIHLMGTAKGLGWAELPQLTQAVSRPVAMLWLLAALLSGGAVLALFAAPRIWWIVGLTALVVSQGAIATSWKDARFGTVGNVILLVGVVIGYLHDGPRSFNASYVRDVASVLARPGRTEVLAEADLAPLPAIVQRYVRQSGAVGQPRVRNFRLRFRGSIRSGPAASWMAFTGEQVNGFHPASRLFLMDGALMGAPFQAFHRYVGPEASMHVKVASLKSMVDAHGALMNEGETVTLLNDLCLFAPGAIPDAQITWEPVDARQVRATFTNAGHTVHAVLVFNDAAELVNFVSDDRGMVSADGRNVTKMRWSTPSRAYRAYGRHWLTTGGDGVWDTPGGSYAYIRFEVVDVAYNVGG